MPKIINKEESTIGIIITIYPNINMVTPLVNNYKDTLKSMSAFGNYSLDLSRFSQNITFQMSIKNH